MEKSVGPWPIYSRRPEGRVQLVQWSYPGLSSTQKLHGFSSRSSTSRLYHPFYYRNRRKWAGNRSSIDAKGETISFLKQGISQEISGVVNIWEGVACECSGNSKVVHLSARASLHHKNGPSKFKIFVGTTTFYIAAAELASQINGTGLRDFVQKGGWKYYGGCAVSTSCRFKRGWAFCYHHFTTVMVDWTDGQLWKWWWG